MLFGVNYSIPRHLPHVQRYSVDFLIFLNGNLQPVNVYYSTQGKIDHTMSTECAYGSHLGSAVTHQIRLQLRRSTDGTSRGENSQTNINELKKSPREAKNSLREPETNTLIVMSCVPTAFKQVVLEL